MEGVGFYLINSTNKGIKNIISKFKNVNNLTGAMIQAIRENWTTNSINNNNFNNFESREYDYDKLEKKLLGWE